MLLHHDCLTSSSADMIAQQGFGAIYHYDTHVNDKTFTHAQLTVRIKMRAAVYNARATAMGLGDSEAVQIKGWK